MLVKAVSKRGIERGHTVPSFMFQGVDCPSSHQRLRLSAQSEHDEAQVVYNLNVVLVVLSLCGVELLEVQRSQAPTTKRSLKRVFFCSNKVQV